MRNPRQFPFRSLLLPVIAGVVVGGGSSRLAAQAVPPPVVARPLVVPPPRFPAPRPATLSPLADTVANFLVFAPVGSEWFTAAVRNHKLLLDIGRVDMEVRRDSARAAAYREAVEKRSTVPLGATIRVRGPWGAEDATTTAVEAWNGRIALRLKGSAALDSLVRVSPSLVVSAQRTDSAEPPVADSCDRKALLTPELTARLAVIRDSVEAVLRAGSPPSYERLRRAMTVKSSQVRGCFGGARRVALLVSLRAGGAEWSRERLALVDTLGHATPVRMNDYRFRAHELLAALDANGDGVDDFVTRALAQRAGGTTMLVLDAKARRATRLSAGFVWEEQ